MKLKLWAPDFAGCDVAVFNNRQTHRLLRLYRWRITTVCGLRAARKTGRTSTTFTRSRYGFLRTALSTPMSQAIRTPRSCCERNQEQDYGPGVGNDKTRRVGTRVAAPPLASLSDLSLYELHVRDFSVNDPTVPANHRGTYEAFADQYTLGMTHLRTLAQDGLKAVHILPSFHFASVNEDKSTWLMPGNLSQYPAAGTQQQAAVTGDADESSVQLGL